MGDMLLVGRWRWRWRWPPTLGAAVAADFPSGLKKGTVSNLSGGWSLSAKTGPSPKSRTSVGRTMPRYVALLRGVSPLNAKMSELRACFESIGFARVRTVLSSGNVVFDAALLNQSAIEAAAQAAMDAILGRRFYTIVRSVSELQDVLASDPYTAHGIPRDAKRVVSFFREQPVPKVALPMAENLASVFLVRGREAYSISRSIRDWARSRRQWFATTRRSNDIFGLIWKWNYTAYRPNDKGPVFMKLIERAFGKDVTTRSLETVAKYAVA